MEYQANIAAISARFAARWPARAAGLVAATEALRAGDPAEALGALTIELHSLAGSAPTLGFVRIGALAREAEHMMLDIRREHATLGASEIEAVRARVLALVVECEEPA